MKILYTTDFHGAKWKFEKTFELAKELKVDLVINGGDLLAGKVSLTRQGNFITNYLDEYFSRFNSEKIFHLCMLGNDDACISDELFENTCQKYLYIRNLARRKVEVLGYEFIGLDLVPDMPFPLKDRCRMDNPDFRFPPQRGIPLKAEKEEMKEIPDWFNYAKSLPTIAEELDMLEKPKKMDKAIYVLHSPPTNIGLDVTYEGKSVGSKATYEFIKKQQPLLSLHGHIHESPSISGVWKANIGRTICIQPGQTYLIYVIIDLDGMKIERFETEK